MVYFRNANQEVYCCYSEGLKRVPDMDNVVQTVFASNICYVGGKYDLLKNGEFAYSTKRVSKIGRNYTGIIYLTDDGELHISEVKREFTLFMENITNFWTSCYMLLVKRNDNKYILYEHRKNFLREVELSTQPKKEVFSFEYETETENISFIYQQFEQQSYIYCQVKKEFVIIGVDTEGNLVINDRTFSLPIPVKYLRGDNGGPLVFLMDGSCHIVRKHDELFLDKISDSPSYPLDYEFKRAKSAQLINYF